jgi:hypothetical protein
MKPKGRVEPTWAVDWMHDGKREVLVNYTAHRTKAEAQMAFEKCQGISWAEAAKAGAKLVKRHWIILPSGKQ